MAYLLRADIENYLNITLPVNGQTLVDSLIPAVEKAIDNYCNRTWSIADSTEIVERFDGGVKKLFVRTPPIASVVSVKTAVSNSYAGDLLAENKDEYYVYSDHVELDRTASHGPRAIEVKYKTAANTAPADVKQAAIQWVADMFKASPDAGKRTSEVQISSMKIKYNVTPDDVPAFVKMVLDKYVLFNL